MESMKVQTSIPSDLYAEAESLAKRLGVSRSELLRRALAAYLGTERARRGDEVVDSEGIREALDEVYSEAASNVDEVLSHIQWASLPKEPW